MRYLLFIVWMGITFLSSNAYAVFPGRVSAERAELRDRPSYSGKIVQIVPKGTAFNANDSGVNGFFQVRTAASTGWLHQSTFERVQPAVAPKVEATPLSIPPYGKQFAWEVFGNFNLYEIGDLNSVLQNKPFSGGLGYGFGGLWYFEPSTGAGVRVSWIKKAASGTDSLTGNTNDLSLSSLIILTRLQRQWKTKGPFTLYGNIHAGIASTSLILKASGVQAPEPNETHFDNAAFTALVSGEAHFNLNQKTSIYIELGYRILSNPEVPPSQLGNGAGFLPRAVSLGLSGPVIQVGCLGRF